MRSPGGTHDSLAWSCTDLCAYLTEHGISDGFYLVGDDAYTGTPWMLTPYPIQRLTRVRSDFNFYQSRCRIHIECSFGILVQRFGILRRPLTCSVRHSCAVVKACMRIHNLAIETKATLNVMPIRTGKERELNWKDKNCEGDRFRPWQQSQGVGDSLPSCIRRERRDKPNTLRDEVCRHLEICGHKRPAYSLHGRGTM